MRSKTPKAVATFASSSDVLAVESQARDGGIPGRAIPVPSEIAAGCGIAWCVPAAERDALEAALRERGLAFEGMHEVYLY